MSFNPERLDVYQAGKAMLDRIMGMLLRLTKSLGK